MPLCLSVPPLPLGAEGCCTVWRTALYIYLRLWTDRSFQHLAVRELKKLDGPFDAVFSTYAPLSVHQAAYQAKKSGLARRWIADFRDEVGMPFRWLEPFHRRYMRMLRKNADLLTTVSKGMLDAIGISDRGRMLSNGFDREDLPEAETPRQEDGRFRVVYCGTIEMGRKGIPPRDLTPFFRALRGVIDQGMLKHEQLRLVYAGREGALFTDYARQCGLEGLRGRTTAPSPGRNPSACSGRRTCCCWPRGIQRAVRAF